MSISVNIETGGKEPIEVMVLDVSGVPLISKTDIEVKLRRQSDDFVYDWDDDTFKSPGSVIDLSYPLEEANATLFPGEYRLSKAGHVNGFDTFTVTNPALNDIYEFTVFQSTDSDAGNLPVTGEMKVGGYLDEIPEFTSNERAEIKSVLGVTGTGTPEMPTTGVMSIILGLVQSNFYLDQTTYNSSGLLVSGRIRIFPDKATTDSATDGGAGEGELASFQISTEAEVSPIDMMPKTYKVTREP